jgi:hypothetical protein
MNLDFSLSSQKPLWNHYRQCEQQSSQRFQKRTERHDQKENLKTGQKASQLGPDKEKPGRPTEERHIESNRVHDR